MSLLTILSPKKRLPTYKNFFLFSFLLGTLFFSFSPSVVSAQTTKPLSLSDAVLADLALHNFLDYVSIDFKDKKSPNTITINQDRQWLPASTIKLFVAMYAAQQIQKRNILLDQWVTIDDKNVVPTEMETNDYPVLTPGLITTVDVLLEKMITQSDNTAYNTLLDLLDRQKVTEYVQSLGLTHTIVGSKLNLDDAQTQYEYTTPGYNINTTTAADYEKAYELIDSNKIPNSKLLFDILKKQKIQNMIPQFLPTKDLIIAHKTGDLDPLYHDGGIVFGDNKHYILTIFTNLGNPYVLAHISQLIFTKNYKLVGAAIPDKSIINPQAPQALDPLVVNPAGFRSVLGAETQINVPIPQITAADLGITANELSLVLPDSKLPKSIIAPSSPLHVLVPLLYETQTLIAVGEKNRQQVALSYAKQLLADAKVLQQSGDSTQVSLYMQHVQTILNAVASDKLLKPDAQTQLAIQATSQTQFAIMKDQINKTTDDSQRTQYIQQVADQAKQTLATVVPNTPEAKTLAAANQQPLIGKVIDNTPNRVVVETASGQKVTVAVSNDTKIVSPTSNSFVPSATSSAQEPSTSSSAQSVLPTPAVQIRATVALIGTIQGSVFTPSVVATNLPRELAAPQPVSVIKVNTKNNTMVVNENGTPIQVDLTSQTPIKGPDTNIPLTQIQPGSVVVVHGTTVEQVKSDTQAAPLPVFPTAIPQSPSTKPEITTTVQPTTTTPRGTIQPTTTTPIISPSRTQSTSIHKAVTPTTSLQQVTSPSGKNSLPTGQAPVPSAAPATPKVIQATSVQVVQQKQTPPTTAAPAAPQSAQKSSPAPQPAQSAPAAPAAATSAPSQQDKNKGK